MSSVELPSKSLYRYEPVEQIGAGTYGIVHKCMVHSKEPGVGRLPGFVARKSITWGPNLNLKEREWALREKEALDSIAPHDGIVRLLDSWVEGNTLCALTIWSERRSFLTDVA